MLTWWLMSALRSKVPRDGWSNCVTACGVTMVTINHCHCYQTHFHCFPFWIMAWNVSYSFELILKSARQMIVSSSNSPSWWIRKSFPPQVQQFFLRVYVVWKHIWESSIQSNKFAYSHFEQLSLLKKQDISIVGGLEKGERGTVSTSELNWMHKCISLLPSL